MYESVMLSEEDIKITSAVEPRYIVTYAHFSREEARRVIEFLEEKCNHERGSIILPIMGRMV